MTEHTPKQIALAEQIAWIVVPRASPDWQVAFDAALAAIVEVSELAAEVCDEQEYSRPDDDHQLGWTEAANAIAIALRNGDHLP